MDSIVEKIGYDVEMGMDLLWVEGEYKKEELIKYLDWCKVIVTGKQIGRAHV